MNGAREGATRVKAVDGRAGEDPGLGFALGVIFADHPTGSSPPGQLPLGPPDSGGREFSGEDLSALLKYTRRISRWRMKRGRPRSIPEGVPGLRSQLGKVKRPRWRSLGRLESGAEGRLPHFMLKEITSSSRRSPPRSRDATEALDDVRLPRDRADLTFARRHDQPCRRCHAAWESAASRVRATFRSMSAPARCRQRTGIREGTGSRSMERPGA